MRTTQHTLPLRPLRGLLSELSDEALVAACAIGDNAALGVLFDRHYEAVRRFLLRVAASADRDVDDLVQMTFETVPRAAKRFDGRASAKVWLFGVAHNIARHHVRAETRRKRVSAEAVALSPAPPVDVTAQMGAREGAARLPAAIAALPEKVREAFVLVYLEGLAGRDVARLLGAREGTVWKWLHEARVRLRDHVVGASS